MASGGDNQRMNQSISLSARQMLALARSSLWQKPVDEALFAGTSVDWQNIAKLALQQTIGSLVCEGALSLPPYLHPSKEWKQRALAFMESNRRTHILVDSCAAEAVGRLKGEGIEAIMLKGQAYSRAYPRPDMRQCGDIDLYVGENNYYPAYEAAKRFGWKCEEKFIPGAKHYGCRINGVRIELHRMAGKLSLNSSDRKFQQWSNKQLSFSEMTIPIGSEDIPVPIPMFDIVFVFLHLYHHFLSGGIGLRHVCDWTMLMHAHSKEINLSELKEILKEFRLMRAWKYFAPIAVDYLGLPKSECPLYSEHYIRQSKRVLLTILKDGNFGRGRMSVAKYPEGYLAWKLYSFRRTSLSQMKKLWIDPNTISRAYGSYVIKGITRIIKDIIKRD